LRLLSPKVNVSQLQNLIEVNNVSSREVILVENDFRFSSIMYDYHELYIDNNNLCGMYNIIVGSDIYAITTFEIPIYQDKKISKPLIRFINRNYNITFLINKLKDLKINNKNLLNVLVKNKKCPVLFKKHFQNWQLLE